jgi:hypothetical protein
VLTPLVFRLLAEKMTDERVMTDEPPVMPDGLVSEPSPFDTVETWEHWLAEVHTWPAGNTKEYCIWNAKREIERIKQHNRARHHGVEWLH